MRDSTDFVVLSVGDDRAASSRVRMGALIAGLTKRGHTVRRVVAVRRTWPLSLLIALIRSRRPVLVVQKVAMRPMLMRLLRRMVTTLFYDLDDAIYLGYPGHEADAPRVARGVEAAVAVADVVVVSNELIASDLASWSRRPPVVFPGPAPEALDELSARDGILWLGSPSTIHNVRSLYASLSDASPPVLVLGAPEDHDESAAVSERKWSPQRQADALRRCRVGLYPLALNSWSERTAGYKILEYLAHGLIPVVSDVPLLSTLLGGELEQLVVVARGDWAEAIERAASTNVDRAWFDARSRVFERWSASRYADIFVRMA